MSRLTQANGDDLRNFITTTARVWMNLKLVKYNSFGVEVLIAQKPGSDFTNATVFNEGDNQSGTAHDTLWYRANAKGKNLICLTTGLDSYEAVRMYPGLVTQIDGAFPWGGAVIDTRYGIIVGVSGFKEDEDILFAKTILNRLVMLLDRDGNDVLIDARKRGEQAGQAGADRFTRITEGLEQIGSAAIFPGQVS